MMQDDADDTIARIAAALRPLPDVDDAQKARVLVAVAAERERDRRRNAGTRRWMRGAAAVAATLVAAGVTGLFVFSRLAGDATSTAASHSPSVDGSRARVPIEMRTTPKELAPAAYMGREADGVALQPVELVFRAPDARRVSVVGDFNGWDARRNAMTRDAATGLWSQTVALRPGRHVYAFIVDDSVWMRDPRTPAANDADFGRPGSVLLVGRP